MLYEVITIKVPTLAFFPAVAQNAASRLVSNDALVQRHYEHRLDAETSTYINLGTVYSTSNYKVSFDYFNRNNFV